MSQIPILPPAQRYAIIKDYVAQETNEQLATRCHCTRRTIDRDIAAMKQTGEWWAWLEHEFRRLQRDPNIPNAVKYREIARLYGRQFITEKAEQTTEHKGQIVIKGWNLGDHDEPDHDPDDSG